MLSYSDKHTTTITGAEDLRDSDARWRQILTKHRFVAVTHAPMQLDCSTETANKKFAELLILNL
jgi:hypothetical protein